MNGRPPEIGGDERGVAADRRRVVKTTWRHAGFLMKRGGDGVRASDPGAPAEAGHTH